jgi:iron-sulfur cluster assembly protein
MINLTESAAKKLAAAVASEETKSLRFGVQGGGCSGYKYVLGKWCRPPHEKDTEIEFEGFSILIHENAVPLLSGTTIDYIEDGLKAEFTFDNPNATSSCGCSSSFSVGNKGGCSS